MTGYKRPAYFFSLRFRIAAAFVLLAAVLLLILNVYPVEMARRQLIQGKEEEMGRDIGFLCAALEGSGTIDYETAATAISIMDIGSERRILVILETGTVVYDSLRTSSAIGKKVLFPEVVEALYGNDVFHSTYDSHGFTHRASCAIMTQGKVRGAIYAYEYDTASADFLNESRRDILRISAAVTLAAGIFIAVFSVSLRRRMNRVLEGVEQIRAGNYDYRIALRGRDELGSIADEFDQLSEHLTREEASRRQFVSDASHELNTPLASVKLLCDSILNSPDIPIGQVREFLLDIRAEVDRLTKISKSLLYLSRLDISSGEEPNGVCDLSYLTHRAADILRGSAEEAHVSISTDLPGDAYAVGSADVAYQVIFNLMENAIKYNKPDGTVQVNLQRGENDEGEPRWILRVADTGIGIAEEEIERIFQRFYRVDKARSRQTSGSGLGLSIVGQCMETLGGHIEVTSTLGEGSCFSVFFLVAPDDGEAEE